MRRTLTLTRETLTDLTPGDLGSVVVAGAHTPTCDCTATTVTVQMLLSPIRSFIGTACTC